MVQTVSFIQTYIFIKIYGAPLRTEIIKRLYLIQIIQLSKIQDREIKMIEKSRQGMDLDGNFDEGEQFSKRVKTQQLCPFIIQSLNPNLDFDVEWIVQLQDQYKKDPMKKQISQFIRNTHIVIGPPRCGKTSYIHWRCSDQPDAHIIKIDCQFHSTPQCFVTQLINQLAKILDIGVKNKKSSKAINTDELSKKLIIDDSVNLKELDKYIIDKQDVKLILVIKNSQHLVNNKRQVLLYNLSEWMKGPVGEQLGIVFITRKLDFVDRFQKRVKSRINPKFIFLMGPQDQKIIKEAILKRISYSYRKCEKSQKNIENNLRSIHKLIHKSTALEKQIKIQQQKSPKQIQFYLYVMSLLFSMAFDDQKISECINSKNEKQFDEVIKHNFQAICEYLPPYVNPEQNLILNMNIPQLLVISVIRKMLIEERKISLKQINKDINVIKQNNYSNSGDSFKYTSKQIERSLKNLIKINVIEIAESKDFDNAQITSNIDPDSIKKIVQRKKGIPTFLSQYIN